MENDRCEYKDERISLTEAYDDRSENLLSWDEVKEFWDEEGKFLIRCPNCFEKVTLVNGEIRNGFFKHFHTGERKQTEGRRNMAGGTSAWHHRWQMRFPEQREKQLSHGEDRADVLLKDKKIAVEFQKSDFTGTEVDTCKKRTVYWNGKGYKVAWVFAWDGGSEFAGYFPRGTGRDGNEQTVMELPEYTKLFGEHVISRDNVEIHFLSLDGSFGFEFLPETLDIDEKVMCGKVIPSYFQPFAPAYRSEFGKIRGKEVYNSHLKEPVVEPIDMELFYNAIKDASDRISSFAAIPCVESPQEDSATKIIKSPEPAQSSETPSNNENEYKTISELWDDNYKWLQLHNKDTDQVIILIHSKAGGINRDFMTSCIRYKYDFGTDAKFYPMSRSDEWSPIWKPIRGRLNNGEFAILKK